MKKVLVCLVVVVVAVVYGVLGWLVYRYYPPRILGEQMIHRGLEEIIREVKADADLLNDRLRVCGVRSALGLKWRREALQRVLKDPASRNLMVKYLGALSISDSRNLSERLQGEVRHQQAVKDAEYRQKALLWDLQGASGPGSEAWEQKMAAVKERLNKLEEDRDAVKSAAREAEIEAMAKIEVLKDELEQAREVFEDRLGEADRLRARRDRLNIWPLPWIAKMMSGKEGA